MGAGDGVDGAGSAVDANGNKIIRDGGGKTYDEKGNRIRDPEDPALVEKKKVAFRTVGKDDVDELTDLLGNVDPKIWLKWTNGAGDTLLKMADLRKKEKSLWVILRDFWSILCVFLDYFLDWKLPILQDAILYPVPSAPTY